MDHKPKVHEISTGYLQAVFGKEIGRLLREGQGGMQIVRSSLAVRDRLQAFYALPLAGLVHGFWLRLSTHGEDEMKERLRRPTGLLHDAAQSAVRLAAGLARQHEDDGKGLRSVARLSAKSIG